VNNVAAFLIPNIFVNNVFRKGNLLKINDIQDMDINIPKGFNDILALGIFLPFLDITSACAAVGNLLLIFLLAIVLIFNSCSCCLRLL
jgi:hypothetical protein